MFVDMGGGGVDKNITDYVDLGRGLQKFDFFCFKFEICLTFSSKIFTFLIYRTDPISGRG